MIFLFKRIIFRFHFNSFEGVYNPNKKNVLSSLLQWAVDLMYPMYPLGSFLRSVDGSEIR